MSFKFSSKGVSFKEARKAMAKMVRLPVIVTVRCKKVFTQKELSHLPANKNDTLNVVEKGKKFYTCVKEDRIGYVPKEYCVTLSRKQKKEVLLPLSIFQTFLSKKKYTDVEIQNVIRIQRWFRLCQKRRVLMKILDRFGRRIATKKELVENDKNYLEYLLAINSLYWSPLKRVLTTEQHDSLFANFPEVLDSAKVVNASLSKYGAVEGLKRELTRLQVNSKYISNYSSAMELWRKMKMMFQKSPNNSKSKKFFEILGRAENDPKCYGLNLQNLLIKPFQRLFTYKNICETLMKLTPPESYMAEVVTKLVDNVSKLCQVVDKEKKIHEGVKKMKTLKIYHAGRQLLSERKLTICINDGKQFLSNTILFNDLFYFKDQKEKQHSLYFVLASVKEFIKKSIIIKSMEVKVQLFFKKKKDFNMYVKLITENINIQQNVLAKRNHGIENIENYIKGYIECRTKKNESFDKILKKKQINVHNEAKLIAHKLKQNTYRNKLVRNNVKALLKSKEVILESKKKINVLIGEINETRKNKNKNVMLLMEYFSKFRECLNNDLNSFYLLFQKDYSYCSRELEKLKKRDTPLSIEEDKKNVSFLKSIVAQKINVVEQLTEGIEKMEGAEKKLVAAKKNKELLKKINDTVAQKKPEDYKEEQIEKLDKKIQKVQKSISKRDKKIAKLKLEIESMKLYSEKTFERNAKMFEENEKIISEEKVKRHAFESDLKAKESELKKMKDDIDNYNNQSKTMKGENKELKKKFDKAKKRIAALEKDMFKDF